MKRSPLRRKTRLRKQSKKSARAARVRRTVTLPAVRAERGEGCESGGFSPACTGVGEHGHELRRRGQGGSATDERNVVWLCAPCHRRVHDYPRLAAEAGLLVMKKGVA